MTEVQLTEAQRKQYDQFLAAGYAPEDAVQMIERGTWLGTTDASAQTVADIEQYRRERDDQRERDSRQARAVP